MTAQLAFDIDALIREVNIANAPEWQGAPLGFTADHYSTAALTAANNYSRELHGNFDHNARHLWSPSYTDREFEVGAHRMSVFSANLRCKHDRREGCSCVGSLVYRGICDTCDLSTQIYTDESKAAAALYDHATPGWRNLPVMPNQTHGKEKKWAKHVIENTPFDWQFQGAPVITERNHRYATRAVQGRSPWGGYDFASVTADGTK